MYKSESATPEDGKSKAELKTCIRTLERIKALLDGGPVKSKRGRRRASPSSIERDQRLYEQWEWERANTNTSKGDFCLRHGVRSIKEFDKILDRVRKRKERE